MWDATLQSLSGAGEPDMFANAVRVVLHQNHDLSKLSRLRTSSVCAGRGARDTEHLVQERHRFARYAMFIVRTHRSR